MADNSLKKEKVEGELNGETISINRVWNGHRFTDHELKVLFEGGEVRVDNLKAANGKIYSVYGEIKKQTYEGNVFYGFDITDFVNEDVPDEWCKHKFTDEEKDLLLNGEKVHLGDCKSKKGKLFTCYISLNDENKLIPDFD